VGSQGPSHVFFDLDGTLIDPALGIVRSLEYALAFLDQPPRPPEFLRGLIGPPLGEVFRELLGTDDRVYLRKAIETYRVRYATVGILEARVFPEIPALLDALVAARLELFVVTSKPKVYADRILDHFAMSERFTGVYGSDLDGLGEDKASLIARALATEGIDPGSVLMVGDRRSDIAGARANGVLAVGVSWGFGSLEEFTMADTVLGNPGDLLSWLHGLRNSAGTRSSGHPDT
jgi:phosphoglycolate phosphatase